MAGTLTWVQITSLESIFYHYFSSRTPKDKLFIKGMRALSPFHHFIVHICLCIITRLYLILRLKLWQVLLFVIGNACAPIIGTSQRFWRFVPYIQMNFLWKQNQCRKVAYHQIPDIQPTCLFPKRNLIRDVKKQMDLSVGRVWPEACVSFWSRDVTVTCLFLSVSILPLNLHWTMKGYWNREKELTLKVDRNVKLRGFLSDKGGFKLESCQVSTSWHFSHKSNANF